MRRIVVIAASVVTVVLWVWFLYVLLNPIPTAYVIISVYNPLEVQTDGTPLITADNSVINYDDVQMWMAVSRDLEKDFPMGSQVHILCDCPYNGEVREIHDRMNSRFTGRIDILTHDSGGLYGGQIQLKR